MITGMGGPQGKTGTSIDHIKMLKKKGFNYREYRPGKYQVYFLHQGKRVFLQRDQDNRPLKNKTQAVNIMLYIDEHGYNPREFNKDKEFRFDVAVKTWIALSTCSDEWLAERKRIAEKFLIPYFGKQDFREIKTVHVNSFEKSLRDKGLGLSYIRNIRDELKAFLRFNKGSIPKMPEFRNIQIQAPMIRWLTPKQQNKVFEKIPKRHIPIFTFLRTYPIRLGEACGLTWNDVFMGAEIPYFVIRNVVTRKGIFKNSTKTKRVRPYSILPELDWIFQRNGHEFVFSRPNGRPYTNGALYAIWRDGNEKVDVPRVSLYQATKHSFGWNRIDQGYSLEDVSLLMGHSSSKMTRRYAGQTLKRMIEILRGNVHRSFTGVQAPKLLEHKENLESQQGGPHGRDLHHSNRPAAHAGRG